MPYRKIGHQKKTAILYIQYIQYSAVCGPLDAPATAFILGLETTEKGPTPPHLWDQAKPMCRYLHHGANTPAPVGSRKGPSA